MDFIYILLGVGFICFVIGITFAAYGYMQDSNLSLGISSYFIIAFGCLVSFALIFNAFFSPTRRAVCEQGNGDRRSRTRTASVSCRTPGI